MNQIIFKNNFNELFKKLSELLSTYYIKTCYIASNELPFYSIWIRNCKFYSEEMISRYEIISIFTDILISLKHYSRLHLYGNINFEDFNKPVLYTDYSYDLFKDISIIDYLILIKNNEEISMFKRYWNSIIWELLELDNSTDFTLEINSYSWITLLNNINLTKDVYGYFIDYSFLDSNASYKINKHNILSKKQIIKILKHNQQNDNKAL